MVSEVAGVPYNGSSITSIAYAVKPPVNGTDGFSTLLVRVCRMHSTSKLKMPLSAHDIREIHGVLAARIRF